MSLDTEIYKLPFLYKTDAKNKERIWIIKVEDGKVMTKSGEVGGKLILHERGISGVNKKNKNITNKYEQAKKVAERMWIKKMDKGYEPKSEKGKKLRKTILNAQKKSGNVNTGLDKLIRNEDEDDDSGSSKCELIILPNGVLSGFETDCKPMHCQKWSNEDKVLKHFDFEKGAYVQPKLDGIRAIIRLQKIGNDYYTVITSRQGKQFVFLNHLRESIKNFLYPKYKNIILDTELYFHKRDDVEERERFNIISQACKTVRSKAHEKEGYMCVYIFDIVDKNLDQTERFDILDNITKNNKDPYIQKVDTYLVHSIEEIEEYNENFKNDNYEGTVVRSSSLKYEYNKRSLKMRKYKEFEDGEFEICGVHKNKGVKDEQFSWICKTSDGTEFRVKPSGNEKTRKEYYKNQDEYIGKQLTVKYQELTKDKIPRFPVGLGIRDYED